MNIDWGEASAAAGLVTLIAGALAWIFLPRCRDFIWHVLKDDPSQFDELRRASQARDTEVFASKVREVLSSELESLEIAARLADSHEDSIRFVRESILQQGKELQQLPAIASAMTAISQTMKEIHIEVQEHGKRFERWDGYMEGLQEWDGRERRTRSRRKSE